jgi:amidase
LVDEVLWLDATAQAELIRDKQLSPRELVEACIARIEAVDPEVNAVIHRRFDKALAEIASELPEGPFAGVPMLIKDLHAESAGDPQHNGNLALKKACHQGTEDSWLIRRYREAGFVFLGRTNTPELGLVPITEPVAYGPTRNPYDLDRSPGGSSGGSAAAVAAGMVALAHGSDGGGSIRIPASMCGLVGLKPSRGRITAGPRGDESGLAVEHVLTRSVRDCAAVLAATAGPGLGDIAVAPPPETSYLSCLEPPRRLRIGFLAASPAGPLHEECKEAVLKTAQLADELGHFVDEDHPAVLDERENAKRFMARWVVGARLSLDNLARLLGREVTEQDVEPITWAMAKAGEAVSGLELATSLQSSSAFARSLGSWWEGHDVFLCPTLGELPPLIGELTPPPEEPLSTQGKTARLVPFTTHFNVSGQPAISLPLHMSSHGLPVGVQLVAAYGREDLLLRLGAELEQVAPWADRRPAL